nr:N-(5'phosphoribosyl)anthranilate (PRA) isomerase [uncultured bacterium]
MNKPHLRYKDQTPRERTWTIHFISIMKFVKGLVLVAVGIRLVTLLGRDVEAWATDFVTRHGIDLANRYVHSALEKLAGVGNTQLLQMSGVAFGYSVLLFTEGIGLWLQKRWAEYLTAIATGLLIPLELYEIYNKFTWVRVGILALNIFVVWYLVTRLKDEKKESATEGTEKFHTRIKICGITNLEDARIAVKLGADELGFNFYEKSPRFVTPEEAGSMIKMIDPAILKTGVFVNETVERICEISAVAGLDAIQLHGDEDNRFIEEVHMMTGLPVIKAFRVSTDFRPLDITHSSAEAVLLDKYSTRERGGTGELFNWKLAKGAYRLVDRLYLAGGLTADNVSEAIKIVRPFAVDACSGIEMEPGKKDHEKLRRFVAAVRETI